MPQCQGNKTRPTDCRQHIVLPQGSWYDSFNGTQFDCSQTNKCNGRNNGPMHPVIGLPLWPLEHKGPISRIRHGIKHTFGCVVSLRSKSTQPCMWAFFHGIDTKEQGAYLYERGVSRQYNNLTVSRCICSQNKARCSLPQLPNRHYLLTHLGQNGPSTAKKPSTLWQRYSSGHRKQHYQVSAFKIYGIEIFLDWRQSGPGYVQLELAPRTRKPSWLPEQALHWLTPCRCETMVLTYVKSPPGITTGSKT